jgi:uncharacterized protein (DUF697 family)
VFFDEAFVRKPSPRFALAVPESRFDIDAAARRSRRIVTRRALLSATAAVVPIPGLDIAVDVNQLLRMIEDVNAEFGLTPLQIERLSTKRRMFAYQVIGTVGSVLVGRILTRDLIVQVLKRVGMRLTAQQAAKWVPLAGQAIAATLSFGSLRWLGEQHIADCVRVAGRMIDLNPPAR